MRAIQHVVDRNRIRRARRHEKRRAVAPDPLEEQKIDPRLLSRAARLDRGGTSAERIAAELGISQALARHLQTTSRDTGEAKPVNVRA